METKRQKKRQGEKKRPHAGPIGAMQRLRQWMATRGWVPHEFQETAWRAYAAGESGLIHVPTGAGKTYAAYLAALADVIDHAQHGLQIVYVTPLRAVSRDIEMALRAPIEALGATVMVDSRTGDTSSASRARQKKRMPEVLVTTPESLCLLLANADAATIFASLQAVIVDEWHELMGTKRGTQTELALARIRTLAPTVRTWALTATIANLETATKHAVGTTSAVPPRIVRATVHRPVIVDALIPPAVGTFSSWSGTLGDTMRSAVMDALDPAQSTLIFTNTRAQAERWFQAILTDRPKWRPVVALHHGSLDRDEREAVEAAIKSGDLRIVVCTASLDLGVDFAPVQRVMQIGSPKGVSRLLQRAGRSGHRPGATCRVTCVPTQAFELVEIAAVREAIARGAVEPREPREKPMDVLVQHLVTCALGSGFSPEAMFDEVRTAAAYRTLTDEEFAWALALVCHGGESLQAYPDFHRVVEIDGVCRVTNPRIARQHRLNVGTIVADASVSIVTTGNKRLGSVEERFAAQLNPGDTFVFAGMLLEFVKLVDLVAVVKKARKPTGQTPQWSGSRLPMSSSLSAAVRHTLHRINAGDFFATELVAVKPMFDDQRRLSRIPAEYEVLAETFESPDGFHLFLYPFSGRLVHDGLAALLALRMARIRRATFTFATNDYGIAFVTPTPFAFATALNSRDLFSEDNLVADTLESVNLSELAKRQFREVARVAGLVQQNHPGAKKAARHLTASTGLLYDVFAKYDPQNRLLQQARREVIDHQFEADRLRHTLARLREAEICCLPICRLTPMAFPLWAERMSGQVSLESLIDRIERMKREWLTAE